MEEQLELFPVDYPAQRETALDSAKRIIYGDREKTYGSPARNLECVARMWSAYLDTKLSANAGKLAINSKDVCAMMNLLKTARFANDPEHIDNVVDGIGYWALVERCDEAPQDS